jgi:hypothetical protein
MIVNHNKEIHLDKQGREAQTNYSQIMDYAPKLNQNMGKSIKLTKEKQLTHMRFIFVTLPIFSLALRIYQNTTIRHLGSRYTKKHRIVFITSTT